MAIQPNALIQAQRTAMALHCRVKSLASHKVIQHSVALLRVTLHHNIGHYQCSKVLEAPVSRSGVVGNFLMWLQGSPP